MISDIEKKNASSIGLDGMLWQLQEECGELIKAIGKYNRTRGIGQKTETTSEEAYKNLVEELTDVEICINHIKYLKSIDNAGIYQQKVAKVHNRYSDETTL